MKQKLLIEKIQFLYLSLRQFLTNSNLGWHIWAWAESQLGIFISGDCKIICNLWGPLKQTNKQTYSKNLNLVNQKLLIEKIPFVYLFLRQFLMNLNLRLDLYRIDKSFKVITFPQLNWCMLLLIKAKFMGNWKRKKREMKVSSLHAEILLCNMLFVICVRL